MRTWFSLLLLFFAMTMPALADLASEDKAIALVCKQPEVKRWEKELSTTKGAGKASFMVSHDSASRYTVTVSEDRPEQQVTFRIYDVDVKTGKVTAEL